MIISWPTLSDETWMRRDLSVAPEIVARVDQQDSNRRKQDSIWIAGDERRFNISAWKRRQLCYNQNKRLFSFSLLSHQTDVPCVGKRKTFRLIWMQVPRKTAIVQSVLTSHLFGDSWPYKDKKRRRFWRRWPEDQPHKAAGFVLNHFRWGWW